PITGTDGDPPIVPGQKDQDAVVAVRLSYAPFVSPLGPEIADVLPLGAANDGHHDLGGGAVRISDELFFQGFGLGGRQKVHIIVNAGLERWFFGYGILPPSQGNTQKSK